ncbi:ATP-binding protein [Solirhodobacter olei]|uniref:ATP-binding protein n=1 Tax=Solirhodobacter olei TaxID=2493082 RepID=UPI001F4E59F4|nr:ATP-binding protein [Solirhodobacter olei]
MMARLRWVALLAAVCLGGAVLVENPIGRLAFASTGGVFLAIALLASGLGILRRHSRLKLQRQVMAIVEHDAAPTFGTDADGAVLFENRAAQERFGRFDGQSFTRATGNLFTNPSAVMFRLQSKAGAVGAAREDVVTRRGHARLSVHRIARGSFLWRLEEMLDRSGGVRGAEAVGLPMLIAEKSGKILYMNDALRRLVGGRPKTLDRIFRQLPLRSGEEAVVSTTSGALRALVAEVEGAGDRREIYLLTASAIGERALGPEEAMFEELPVALARISAGGALRAANRLGRELLGLARDEAPMFTDLVEGLGRPVADWLTDTAAGRGQNRSEVLRATRLGENRFLQISLRRTIDHGTSGILAVLSDATELKTLEAQVVQSQKMQAIGQLAGGVAHDFNNLLTAISGHCDLLLLRHEKDDPDYGDLVQVRQNTNRAASLVRQLLAFSRKQTMTPEVLDLHDVLGDLTHLLNRLVGEKVTLVRSYDDSLAPIRADKRQLEQALMNLIVNARDAMPAGGRIWIETESRELTEDLHRDRAVVPAGDYTVVRVRDEGSGIAPDRLSKIFEPFYTTKRPGEGTGLGLSTAYGIVKQTGGFIFVDSIVGTGTTFSLYFPTHDDSSAPNPGAGQEDPARTPLPELEECLAGGSVILLVEDEAPVRAFASRALRLRGYTVLEAENGEQALEMLSDPELKVDVFVSDVIMPGMDGPTWVREALKKRPKVRVVFVSGYAEDAFSDTQARIPNSVFLPKPFSLSELTATVQGQVH